MFLIFFITLYYINMIYLAYEKNSYFTLADHGGHQTLHCTEKAIGY